MVRGDALHILFTKGIYGHLIGSILRYACWYEGPGKVALKPTWERLACIFDQVPGDVPDARDNMQID